MRTTLTINDDIDARLRRVAQEQNRPYKAVVNEALANGLESLEVAEPVPTYHVPAKSYGLNAGIDRHKLNQLLDEIET